MPIKEQTAIRPLESREDFVETRLEAVGFIFHGIASAAKAKGSSPTGTNLLHFARCAKLERIGDDETKIWFRNVRVAHQHLDEHFGSKRWRWCKSCEREITQRVLDEK